jgi:hypothetical protein
MDPSKSSVMVRIYHSLIKFSHIEDFLNTYNLREHISKYAMCLTACYIADMKLRAMSMELRPSKTGRILEAVGQDQEIREAFCCVLASPLSVDGNVLREADVSFALDRAVGMIRSVLGPSFLYKCVYHGQFSADGKHDTIHSSTVRMPMPAENTTINLITAGAIENLFDGLSTAAEDVRSRVERSMYYLYRGTEEHDFLLYWIALEILGRGKVSNIQRMMHQAYGSCHLHEIGRKLGLQLLHGWRNDVVHRGRRISLSAEVERLMQFLVIDLAAEELKLERRKMYVGAASVLGIDLSDFQPLSRGNVA